MNPQMVMNYEYNAKSLLISILFTINYDILFNRNKCK